MLHVTLDTENKIVLFAPEGALSKEDFEHATSIIDPFIKQHGKLNGLIIYTEFFPGWEDFGALMQHLTFVKNHHHNIQCIALVSDSILGNFSETIVSHFIDAQIKQFSFTELEEAKKWILSTL